MQFWAGLGLKLLKAGLRRAGAQNWIGLFSGFIVSLQGEDRAGVEDLAPLTLGLAWKC